MWSKAKRVKGHMDFFWDAGNDLPRWPVCAGRAEISRLTSRRRAEQARAAYWSARSASNQVRWTEPRLSTRPSWLRILGLIRLSGERAGLRRLRRTPSDPTTNSLQLRHSLQNSAISRHA